MPAVLLKMNFIITLPSADSLGYRLVDPQLLSFVWNKLIANKNIIFSLSFHISTVGTITRILKNFQFKNTLSSCFHDTLPPVSGQLPRVKTTHYQIWLTAGPNSACDTAQLAKGRQKVFSWLVHGKDVKLSENYGLYSGWTTDFFRDITEWTYLDR